MRRITQLALLALLALLLVASTLALRNKPLEAQAQEPETFVPTERLPADSAVSFPVDI